MRKRYKFGLLAFGLLALAFYIFQMPHSSLNSDLAQGENMPMLENGLVDYLEIANQRLSENVTVDNNVVVDLVQLFGTERYLAPNIEAEFLEKLGDPQLSDELYQDSFSFAREHGILDDDASDYIDTVSKKYSTPWNDNDDPILAEWLKANNKFLDKMVLASQKQHYYHPLCSEGGVVIGALLPYAQDMREIARALSLRAMHELELGNGDNCLRDIGAIRRLGKLMDQGGTLVENLIGYAILGIAFDKENVVLQAIANGLEVSDSALAEHRKVIQETSNLIYLSRTISEGTESLFTRDVFQRLESGDVGILNEMNNMMGGQGGGMPPQFVSLLSGITDWKVAQATADEFMDKIKAALAVEDDQARHVAVAKIETDMAESESLSRPVSTIMRALAGAKSRGGLVGEILTSTLSPAIIQVDDARTRSISYEIADVGFAIEAYRRQNGGFPDSLDQLVPDFINRLPKDRFNGQALKYKSEPNGYRIWVAGRNRLDEQIDKDGILVPLPDMEDSDNPPTIADDIRLDIRIKK